MGNYEIDVMQTVVYHHTIKVKNALPEHIEEVLEKLDKEDPAFFSDAEDIADWLEGKELEVEDVVIDDSGEHEFEYDYGEAKDEEKQREVEE